MIREVEGIAIAKQKGKYKGRKPTAQEKATQVMELLEKGMTNKPLPDPEGRDRKVDRGGRGDKEKIFYRTICRRKGSSVTGLHER